MRDRLKTVLITALVVLVLLAGIGLVVIYTGGYNVAATAPHWDVTEWALNTLQHTSVGARADDVSGDLPTDTAALEHGFQHFHAMCVQCHGAPGFDRGELGKGMRPVPPRLELEAHEWTNEEIFWITKHGIRLAGMPAFGETHSDEEVWQIAAFVRQLEDMTEAEYARLVSAMQSAAEAAGNGTGAGTGGHSHAPGTAPHEH